MNLKPTALLLLLMLKASAAWAETPSSLLNASYDVSRELFAQINPAFANHWLGNTKRKIEIKQSHAGSTAQARAVLEGLQADVVTFNQVTDIQALSGKGKIAPDWQKRLANNSVPYYSLPVFLVRKGNPKGVKDWDDLVRADVKAVFPNPRTSGNGRYTYLAAMAYAHDKYAGDKVKSLDFVKKLIANVPIFDTGGRASTTTFAQRGIGDVLITFEAEAHAARRELGEDKFDVVTPSVSLQADFPVAVVDKVVDQRGSRDVASAYLAFLYTPEAQDIIARNFYRPTDAAAAAQYAAQFPKVRLLSADSLGGWDVIAKEHLAIGGTLDQAFNLK